MAVPATIRTPGTVRAPATVRVPGSRVPGPFEFVPVAGERNALAWAGLSYTFGEQGFPQLTTVQPYQNVRAVNPTDMSGPQPAALVDLVAWPDRESLLEGSTNQLARNWPELQDWVVHHRAVGGSELNDQAQGSAPYNNQMAQVSDVVTLLAPDQVVYRALCTSGFGFIESVFNGEPWASFEVRLRALLASYRADLPAITGQSFEFPMFLHQTSFWVFGGPAAASIYARDQLALALADPDFILTGPFHQYLVGPDNVHLTNQAYRAAASHLGEVFTQVFQRGIAWRPLHMTGATAGPGDAVTVSYHVPSTAYGRHPGGPALVLDSTAYGWRSPPAGTTDHGFRYVPNGNPARAVTGVAVVGDQVVISLDGPPAAGAEVGYSDFAAQWPSGPAGNLRDSWTNPGGSESGEPLFNWACVDGAVIA